MDRRASCIMPFWKHYIEISKHNFLFKIYLLCFISACFIDFCSYEIILLYYVLFYFQFYTFINECIFDILLFSAATKIRFCIMPRKVINRNFEAGLQLFFMLVSVN
jgi:hypothetical protein